MVDLNNPDFWSDASVVTPEQLNDPSFWGDAEVLEAPNNTVYDEANDRMLSVPTTLSAQETQRMIEQEVDKPEVKLLPAAVSVARTAAPRTRALPVPAQLKPAIALGTEAAPALQGAAAFAAVGIPQALATTQIALGETAVAGAQDTRTFLESIALTPEEMASPTGFIPAFGKLFDYYKRELIQRPLVRSGAAEALISAGEAMRAENQEFAERSGITQKPADPTGQVIYDVGQGGGSLAASIGLTALTRDPRAATIFFAGMQNAKVYREAREAGADPERAADLGAVAGLVEGGLEYVGISQFMKIARGSSGARAFVGGFLTEGVQEGSQSAAEEAITQLSGIRNKELRQTVEDILYEAMIGAVVGGGSATAMSAFVQEKAEEAGIPAGVGRVMAEYTRVNVGQAELNSEEIALQMMSPITTTAETNSQAAETLKAFQSGNDITTSKLTEQEMKQVNLITELVNRDQRVRAQVQLDRQRRTQEQVTRERFADVGVKINPEDVKQLRQQARAIRQSFDRGSVEAVRQATREEVQKTQELVTSIVKNSGLSKDKQAKYFAAIRGIQSPESFNRTEQNQLRGKVARLVRRIEVDLRRQVRSAAKKQLKDTAPKLQEGKPVGKFTPETQRVLDVMRGAFSTTAKRANEILTERLGRDVPLTGSEALENRILAVVADTQGNQPLDSYVGLLNDILEVRETGKAGKALRDLERTERSEKLRNNAFNTIHAGVDPVGRRSDNLPKRTRQFLTKSLKTSFKTMSGWNNLMDMLSFDDKTSRAGESKLSRDMDVFPAEQQEKVVFRKWQTRLMQMTRDVFGTEKEAQLLKKFREDTSEVLDLGTFKDLNGEIVNLDLTRAEARKIEMELRDPSIAETITSEDGNAWTDAMVTAMRRALTSEDYQFIEAQLELYQDFYTEINQVYRKIYGVDLPQNEFYSPIARRQDAQDDAANVSPLLQELSYRGSVAPGAVKSRTKNFNALALRNDIDVLQNYTAQMSHFIAWAEKIQDINTVFGDQRTRDMIEAKYGQNILRVIDNQIQDFTTNGRALPGIAGKVLNTVRNNLVVSQLALKPALAFKQLTSFVAYAETVPTTAFISGIADFARNPVKAVETLGKSPLMIERGQNIDHDIRDAVKSREFEAFRNNPSLKNTLLWFTRRGDLGAIYLGGWALYKHRLDQGDTPAQALEAFERFTSSTQQSTDLSQLSEWQRNPMLRIFGTFASSQNQYMRKEVEAVRGLFSGRVPADQAAKTLAIYHFILPMFFQWMADGFHWDDDNQLRAGLLGSMNGIFILKDMLDYGARVALDQQDFGLQLAPVERPLERIAKATGDVLNATFSDGDFVDAIKNFSIATGDITGVPVKRLMDIYGAVEDFEDDPYESSMVLMGWSPWVMKQQEKDTTPDRPERYLQSQ